MAVFARINKFSCFFVNISFVIITLLVSIYCTIARQKGLLNKDKMFVIPCNHMKDYKIINYGENEKHVHRKDEVKFSCRKHMFKWII